MSMPNHWSQPITLGSLKHLIAAVAFIVGCAVATMGFFDARAGERFALKTDVTAIDVKVGTIDARLQRIERQNDQILLHLEERVRDRAVP